MFDKQVLEDPEVEKKIEDYFREQKSVAEAEKEYGDTSYVQARQYSLAKMATALSTLLTMKELEYSLKVWQIKTS